MVAVLRKIWAVYAVVLFLLLMLVLGVPVLLLHMALTPGERALRRNVYFLHHIFTPIYLALIGIRLRVEGREYLSPERSYVIVSNHVSALDFIVNARAYPGVFQFLAKQELHRVPIFGWVVKKMCLSVDRSDAASRARSLMLLRERLAKGWSIFVYPEGRRNRTAEPLGPFYDGAFRVAIQTQAPIAVQTLTNMREICGKADGLDLRPGVVHIVWSKPIETVGMTLEDLPYLREQVQQTMLKHIAKHTFLSEKPHLTSSL
ncbi:MAG: 1-acyl-sn-glycerol-3-phosphate acyltransferase [Saprospiraceae bacterium]|nr:1-acyl-sn-glycerol-3-phosphate acyltransferase [Saprospiraceae bacterium]MDW8484064.1 lysophospholipid acyltransferase family protein [Saprospiraceae bacterium]